MKIVQLIYTNGIAGAEVYLQRLLPPLKEYDIECHLIVVCKKEAEQLLSEYCEKMKTAGIPATLFVSNRIGFIKTAKKINRYCAENSISLIHSHLLNSDIIAVIIKSFFNKNILLISTKHGYQESYFINNLDKIGKKPLNFYYFLAKYLIARINYNITISRAVSDLYYDLQLTPQKMYFIHHGIDINQDAIKNNANKNDKSNGPKIIIAGRLAKIKGHSYLFDAMPAIITQFPDVQLQVMGEGIEYVPLQKKSVELGIQKNVQFVGFQQNPDCHIAASDIIVLPSLYEPFGLVYIESFALKTPVVAFDVKACNEIIEHEQTGILVPAKDSSGLANQIIRLLQNPAEGKRLAENGYQKYQEYYNTDRMVKDTANWYNTSLPKIC